MNPKLEGDHLERLVTAIESIAVSLSGLLQQNSKNIAETNSQFMNREQRLRQIRQEAGRKGGQISGKSRSKTKQNRSKSEAKSKQNEAKSGFASPPCIKAMWNERCGSLPKCERMTTKRLSAWKLRWKEHPDQEYWWEAISALASSDFCNGGGNRHWKASIDFLLRPDTAVKAREGAYGNGHDTSASVYQFRKFE